MLSYQLQEGHRRSHRKKLFESYYQNYSCSMHAYSRILKKLLFERQPSSHWKRLKLNITLIQPTYVRSSQVGLEKTTVYVSVGQRHERIVWKGFFLMILHSDHLQDMQTRCFWALMCWHSTIKRLRIKHQLLEKQRSHVVYTLKVFPWFRESNLSDA